MNETDLEEGDLLWCIGGDDESNWRSPYLSTVRPRPVMVVETDPLKVSNFYGGEPDTDTNATTTFGPQDPDDFLYETESDAWMAYAEHLHDKAETRRKQAESLDERAKNLREGIAGGRDPEDLTLLDMGSTPKHVDRVQEEEVTRPMGTFPHEFDPDNPNQSDE